MSRAFTTGPRQMPAGRETLHAGAGCPIERQGTREPVDRQVYPPPAPPRRPLRRVEFRRTAALRTTETPLSRKRISTPSPRSRAPCPGAVYVPVAADGRAAFETPVEVVSRAHGEGGCRSAQHGSDHRVNRRLAPERAGRLEQHNDAVLRRAHALEGVLHDRLGGGLITGQPSGTVDDRGAVATGGIRDVCALGGHEQTLLVDEALARFDAPGHERHTHKGPEILVSDALAPSARRNHDEDVSFSQVTLLLMRMAQVRWACSPASYPRGLASIHRSAESFDHWGLDRG